MGIHDFLFQHYFNTLTYNWFRIVNFIINYSTSKRILDIGGLKKLPYILLVNLWFSLCSVICDDIRNRYLYTQDINKQFCTYIYVYNFVLRPCY